MVTAINRGLSVCDFDEMTVGMIIDYVLYYDEQKNGNKKEANREATQADIDAFFGG